MGALSKLPNIGEKLEEKLNRVEIITEKDLKEIGSKEAFLRVRAIDSSACINLLCALEGAIEGIRWHHLSKQTKEELNDFYESSQKTK